jgi:hypothetical protein
MTKTTIEDRSRVQIAQFLPDAIARALTSYRLFMETEAPAGAPGEEGKSDARRFSEHHGACKAAIAHIELLLKLARWADLPGGAADAKDNAMLTAMLAEAAAELAEIGAGE